MCISAVCTITQIPDSTYRTQSDAPTRVLLRHLSPRVMVCWAAARAGSPRFSCHATVNGYELRHSSRLSDVRRQGSGVRRGHAPPGLVPANAKTVSRVCARGASAIAISHRESGLGSPLGVLDTRLRLEGVCQRSVGLWRARLPLRLATQHTVCITIPEYKLT